MMATILGEFDITALPEEVAGARDQVVDLARSYEGIAEETLYEIKVLSSELLTNAIVHTGTRRVSVQVAVDEPSRLLRVVVCDDGSGGPIAIPDAGLLSESGRGLDLLKSLAAGWGVERDGYGSAVWFEAKL